GLNLIKTKTGAQVIVHEKEAPVLRQGIITIPKGVNAIGKITSFIGKRFLTGKKAYKPIEPDLISDNAPLSLEIIGFPLHILHTPGHTAGSVSVFDPESARLFCGDAAFNLPLLTSGKHFPPFADFPEQVTKSWQKMIATGATHCYPGHGKAFPASSLLDEISKK
ncbi:MAG: MBL fold metallo-hydrolase, partial [Bacteroidota bacterium]